MSKLAEGEKKITDLPTGKDHKMVEERLFGLHSITIEKMGVQASKVYVRDYPAWDSAFNAAMDKAGL